MQLNTFGRGKGGTFLRLIPFKTLLIMKLVIVLIIVSTLQLSAKTYAQKISLSRHNATLEEVLNDIHRQTGYLFLYDSRALKGLSGINVNVKKVSLQDALDQCIAKYSLGYLLEDKTILVFPKEQAEAILKPSKVVEGTVTDDNGKALSGVTVRIRNSNIGTITDQNGHFSIEVAGDNTILQFSYLGFQTQEVTVGSHAKLNVRLQESTSSLNQLVVVGYGTEKKIDLTGSIATISGKALTKTPVANVTQALAGRLPGLEFKETTGQPGDVPNINIRGFGAPLIIVDGVEQDNYSNIDPHNIASISILKDASAAIYGARAGNGVILITTKRGDIGAPVITLNSSVSMQSPTIYPKFVNSWEFATIRNEAKAFAGQPALYSDADIEKFKAGTDPDYPNSNMYDAVIKKWSLMQNDNLNISGGNKVARYFLSLGYLYQDGIYRSNGVGMNRHNLRSNVDVNVTKNLSVGADISGRFSVIHDVPTNNLNAGYASQHDIFQAIGTSAPIYPSSYPDLTKTPFDGRNSISPINQINPDIAGTNNTNDKYLTGALSLNYKIPAIPGLEASVKGNLIDEENYHKIWTKPYATYYYDRNSDTYSIAATGGKYSLTEAYSHAQYLTFQGLLNYKHTFGNNSIKGLFVWEVIDDKANSFNGYKDGFISGAVQELFAGSNANMSTNGSGSEDSRMSYAGRINYAYKDKYLAEGTLRYDASSLFPSDSRWGLFPSISLGWRLSEENFIKDDPSLSFIDNLKLRLSYSHTGYDLNAADYEYLSTYSFNSQYAFGNPPTPYQGLATNGISNPYITWEDLYTYNAGLDIDLWNGLLGAEMDVFYRLRTHVLGTTIATLPTTFGGKLPLQNINSTDNRGFEFVLNHKNNIGRFHYSASANISWSRSKYVRFVEQITDDPDLNREKLKTGQWTNRTFGYLTDGFWQSQEEIDNSPVNNDGADNKTLHPGMVKYVDVNHDDTINFRDKVVIGKGSMPDMYYGLNLNASYKGFDFNVLFQGATDFDIHFSNNMQSLIVGNAWNAYQFLFDGRWAPDNPHAQFPATTPTPNSNNTKISDLWVRSASYLRLKNFSIGFTLPENISKRIRLNMVRIYIAGYNVLTLDKLGNFPIDPEAPDGSSWYYPQYKSYSFGLNISL